MNRKLVIGLIILAVLWTPVCAGAKSVILEHRFSKGQVDKYKLSMDIKAHMPQLAAANMPQSIKMSMKMTFSQKVLDVKPDGSARVQMTYSNMEFNIPGLDAKAAKAMPMQPVSVVASISKYGQILNIEGIDQMLASAGMPGMDYSQLAGQIGYYGVFPDVPVEVGQSWISTIPFPLGSGDLLITSTLLGAAVPMGKDVVSKIKQTYEAYIDLGDMMKGFASMMSASLPGSDALSQMSGAMDIVGLSVIYFSPDKGKLIKANGNIKMLLSMDMPAQYVQQGAPSSIDIEMDMNMNVAKL